MDILSNPVATASNTSGAGRAGAETDGGSVLSSDFETFIRMLTVQMENQDPLNPIESTDFATQLATFSGVEQQVLTNDLLESLGGQLGSLGVAQLSGWIGMEGRAITPISFNGDPVRLSISGVSLADSHQFVVRDSRGAEVQRIAVSGETQEISWEGFDDDGAHLPSGTYQISVESFSQGDLVATTPAQVQGGLDESSLFEQTHIV